MTAYWNLVFSKRKQKTDSTIKPCYKLCYTPIFQVSPTGQHSGLTLVLSKMAQDITVDAH